MEQVFFVPTLAGDKVEVIGQAECGMTFHVGAVLEPDSENPVLRLDMPLGMRGVRQVLDEWEKFKRSA